MSKKLVYISGKYGGKEENKIENSAIALRTLHVRLNRLAIG